MKKNLFFDGIKSSWLAPFTRYAIMYVVLQLISIDLCAQTSPISGKVTDSEGPLPGVSVKVQGTSTGVITDTEGNYNVQASKDAVLEFTFIGYTTQSINVNSRSTINVVMSAGSESLNEVVVIGYGTAKKSDLTGSVATVKADELLDRPTTNITQALQGRVAGVEVSLNTNAPGESAKVRIRGISSINSGLSPLYVIDGVIGVDVNSINPNDVASLEVLKDASATAIYGARGANGVILITTNRGINGKSRISFESYASVNTLQRSLKALNAEQFMDVYNLAYQNAEKYDPVGFAQGKYIAVNPAELPNLFDASGNPLYDTNWEEEVYKPSLSSSQQLNIQGGAEKLAYSLSLGLLDQNGLMIESGFTRYSGRFTLDNDVNKWLKIGGSLSVLKSKERLISDANGGLNVSRMVIEGIPIVPVKYPDGTWGGNGDFPGMEGGSNPVNIANNRYTLVNRVNSLGNVYALFRISKDLEFKTDFGSTLNNQKNNFYSGRELSSLSLNERGVANINNWMTSLLAE